MLEGRQIVARQLGRIAFGAVLIAGAVYLALTAVKTAAPWPEAFRTEYHADRIIAWTWLIAAVAGLAVAQITARMERDSQPERLFAASMMVPTLGIAALGPITLHMAVVLPIWGSDAFDIWVLESLIVTGLTHIVFATASAMRARELVTGKRARSPRSIYVTTVVASCVPFVLLYGIPPLLVAITGLPFLPLLRAMEPLVARERRHIAAAMHALPRATLRVRRDAGP